MHWSSLLRARLSTSVPCVHPGPRAPPSPQATEGRGRGGFGACEVSGRPLHTRMKRQGGAVTQPDTRAKHSLGAVTVFPETASSWAGWAGTGGQTGAEQAGESTSATSPGLAAF